MKKLFLISIFAVMAITSCNKTDKIFDAMGNFEAEEILISTESAGKIILFDKSEGDKVNENEILAVIDTVQLFLKMKQSEAQMNAVATKIPNVLAQINVLKEQNKSLFVEKNRIDNLIKGKAATQQQLDNIEGKIAVNNKQMDQIEQQNLTVISEMKIYQYQIEQLKDQIKKCKIVSPITGTIIAKYYNKGEIAFQGKPILKLADLTQMKLKVYVSAQQLTKIAIGDICQVKIDNGKDYINYKGKISVISDKAEFTPKTIQTKEERIKYVYAVEILVKNDGTIKSGMPAEVIF